MLINEKLANLLVATEFGDIVFNEKGENNDLKPEEQKKLGALPEFSYVEDKKEEKPKTVEKPKTTPKKPLSTKKEEK